MLPSSVSGNGLTNQEVSGGQSPGAGSAVVLHEALLIKEVVMITNTASCVRGFSASFMINYVSEIYCE